MNKTNAIKTVDEYILQFPEVVQKLLHQMRKTIKTAAPKAEEIISYQMPAYKYNGVLVYFAGYKNHIGFYATPNAHEAFKNKLGKYKVGKGSVQFPIDTPMPITLISQMVKFKVAENEKKIIAKQSGRNLIRSVKTPTVLIK